MSASNDCAPHERLKERTDNLFLQQKKCTGLQTGLIGANSWRVSHRGLRTEPDPPSMLMFLHYEVSNNARRLCAVPISTHVFLVSSSSVV